MVTFKVVWSDKALFQLKDAIQYLKEKSPQSALKVKRSLLNTAKDLSINPEVYSIDRFKKDNDGIFRSFEKYSYRVTYQIKENEVLILRLRHTSREPIQD